ncbi:MAG: D-glycero-beta-D-manno-heptose 1,7-bisphosphate 7-phosphatase [Aquabacterium sp.]|jgi:D-glycero-D-manno-heptose 1,7-bisphosphate phosphatase|uniref:D-glycero-beta-D-manno-heptose 1,7-bisphosphate 7-phosphatase n=1 Tax=Aquabacterium sp. TaxID=1872578 RepID=UPI001B4D72A1|nr:D-glycero-beta-D-manno-heptose 1,7-bisphosphate 7-phosphatase [Aquabacterium sp.]MBP7132879.1 D-glycero-beta-D-manno-heptose 1,7-bisphosphate 7-phosphatase [Aquabacterium sp.]MBP9063609.1 D-glycero-beta-D-manno-heptose 1,7-bisphosphate 7-phosphatase [Aquabacterium sp.]MDQ5925116.1 D-glycero-D-manno-heptose 1,7-bisphosphate phosphatase [Pseudomonadota bacterium]
MKLVILDRDGTINHEREDYIKSPEEWVPLPGALEAIARLNHAGWHVVVATNQSGIGRGLFDMVALNAMHAKMNQMLAKVGGRVEAVFFCPHTPEDHCTCRKPMPGLFQMIGQRFGRSLEGVPMVGDLPRDVLAAQSVGCEPHLVRTGQAATMPESELQNLRQQVTGLTIHPNLSAFADYLIFRDRRVQGEDSPVSTHIGELS